MMNTSSSTPPVAETGTGGVRVSTLSNGLRVDSESMPDVRSVSVGIWIDAGSRDEKPQVAGASHFLEHLLFKGTARRSAQEIAESLDAVGGDMNAFTSKEYTCFYARCLDRDLPLAVDVLGDMMTSSRVRSADVDAERDVVLEEIRMHLDTPDDLVHSLWSEAFFREHPLGREVLGSVDSITNMTRAQVHRYYRRAYVPANLVIAAAGNLDHDRLVELVGDVFGGIEDPGTPLRKSVPPLQPEPAAAFTKKPTEQVHLVLGGPGLARGDDRRWAAAVLNQALGGGMASRLFQEVREKRGLVYTVYSYQEVHGDVGAFAVYAGSAPQRAQEVLQVVTTELAKARGDGLSEAELARAKGNLTGSLVLSLEDTGSRMSRLGLSLITGTPLLTLDEVVAAVEAVTLEDTRAVGEVLLGGPQTLAAVGSVDAKLRLRLQRVLSAA